MHYTYSKFFIHRMIKAVYFNNRRKVVEEENIKTFFKFYTCEDHFVVCVCVYACVCATLNDIYTCF